MRDGFVKVAAGTPKIRVADCDYNAGQIIALMQEAAAQGVKVLALPELCVTGYTCGDLFLQPTLLDGAERALRRILDETIELDMVTALGLPVRYENKLYNCAAVIQKGAILALAPKTHIPNYGEFYEARWFAPSSEKLNGHEFGLAGLPVRMVTHPLVECGTVPGLVIGVEICEDLWAPVPPSVRLAAEGATLILNLSASDEVAGKSDYRRALVTGQSARLVCGYVYADAGESESSTDLVFAGHNMIAENGTLLAEQRFSTGLTVSEIDVERLTYERQRMNTYAFPPSDGYIFSDYCKFEREDIEFKSYLLRKFSEFKIAQLLFARHFQNALNDISSPLTLCVKAPTEMKSTPASPYDLRFSRVIPPEDSVSIVPFTSFTASLVSSGVKLSNIMRSTPPMAITLRISSRERTSTSIFRFLLCSLQYSRARSIAFSMPPAKSI